jgi:adenylylsulfate kinase
MHQTTASNSELETHNSKLFNKPFNTQTTPETRPAQIPVAPPWQISQPGLTVWFTGLSGAGKTTLATALGHRLRRADVPTIVLDADVLRQGFCAGLGFSRDDRTENVRRIAALAARLSQSGTVVLVAAIAPYRDVRLAARERIGSFLEVYVNAPLQTCVQRDPKGLYARALAGEIPHFTGISDPYEEPLSPDIECRTDIHTIDACISTLLAHIDRYRRSQQASTPEPIILNDFPARLLPTAEGEGPLST